MAAITISRQMGSGGNEVARQVAHTLGWRRVCRDLINRAARAAGTPQLALAEIDELGLLGLRSSNKERHAFQTEAERFIRELATEGEVVIVGRGGQIVLRDWPDILHVRLVAPLEARIARLQAEKQISLQAAQARLEKSDATRAHYLQRNFQARLDNSTLYHLVLNTALLNISHCADLVVRTFWMAAGDKAE